VINDLMEGIKASLASPTESGQEKFYGVVVGKVINPLDPLMLGRVQVQTPFVDSLDLAPWARISQAMAGPFNGSYFVPNLGDEVLVAFEQGDVNAPYVLGSLANMVSRPPMPSPLPQIRTIRTLVGNQITFVEAPPSIVIQNGPTPPSVAPAPPVPSPPYQTIALTNAGVDILSGTHVMLQAGVAVVMVTPAAIVLQVGTTSLAVSEAGVLINGKTIQALGTASVGITAPMVRINS
jgi:phage baseplate assembly protein gpV